MGGWEIGEGVGWEERGFKPNGTATEHREGGGPFGLESLYISAQKNGVFRKNVGIPDIYRWVW